MKTHAEGKGWRVGASGNSQPKAVRCWVLLCCVWETCTGIINFESIWRIGDYLRHTHSPWGNSFIFIQWNIKKRTNWKTKIIIQSVCLFVYVYICKCMCVCVCACLCVCVQAHTFIFVDMWVVVSVSKSLGGHLCTHLYARMCVYVCGCTYVFVGSPLNSLPVLMAKKDD